LKFALALPQSKQEQCFRTDINYSPANNVHEEKCEEETEKKHFHSIKTQKQAIVSLMVFCSGLGAADQ